MDDVAKLIAGAQNGDKKAYGQVYNLFFAKIYRFVYYSVGNTAIAEDIAQDTFLRAWKALPGFSQGKGTFQAFLFAIARNLIIDRSRKKKETALEFAEQIPSGENLEDNFDQKEREKTVHKALSYLDKFEKELVMLRFFEELSYEEIAKITKKNAGAVRVRVHRALKKLEEILKNGI